MFLAFNNELPKSIARNSRQIIQSYLNTNSTMCSCPFHKDRTPSFKIFEDGFKCYGCGIYGNAISFVQEYFHQSFVDAIKTIQSDGLHTNSDIMVNSSDQHGSSCHGDRSFCEIRYRSNPWSNVFTAYWNEFGISLKTLKENGVVPVKEVFLSGDSGFYLYHEHSRKNPGFVYDLGDGYLKVYFPYAKRNKFIGNCPGSMWQGQIDYTPDHLIITSSLKDKMLLEEYGYNAAAPQSENVIPDLSTVKDSFEQIVVFFDNGMEEIRCGQALAEQLGCTYTYIQPSFEAKDPSDFYYYFGDEWTGDLLDQLLNSNLIIHG
jgi:hypothetical protein